MLEKIQIAICDENINDILDMKRMLKNWSSHRGYAVMISQFVCGRDFMRTYQSGRHFDLIFLGDQLKHMTGMEIARNLREYDKIVELVFLAQTAEYAIQGYAVKAKQYFLKPAYEHELELVQVLDEVYDKLASEKYRSLWIKSLKQKILFKDIIYIESSAKNLLVHTVTDHTYNFPDQLSRMTLDLDSRFLRCNRSYMINMDHVAAVETDFVMDNGEIIPIKVRSRKEIRDKYFEYIKQKN